MGPGASVSSDSAGAQSRAVPSADPAARWGHRTPTNGDDRDMVFGYAATAMVRVRDLGTTDLFPVVCERLVLRPLSRGGVPAAFDAIDSLRAKAGATVNEVLADILYSQSVPEKWVFPLRERGIAATFDLHPNDRGPRYDQHSGALWIDGWPHCPNTPAQLLDLTHPRNLSPAPEPVPEKVAPTGEAAATRKKRPQPVPTVRRQSSAARAEAKAVQVAQQAELDRAALNEYKTLIAERSKYGFRRIAGPTATGSERFTCPARAGYIAAPAAPCQRCCPESTTCPTRPTPPTPTAPPAAPRRPSPPPETCSQRPANSTATAPTSGSSPTPAEPASRDCSANSNNPAAARSDAAGPA